MLERSIVGKVKIDDTEVGLVRQVCSEQVTGRRPRGSPRNVVLKTSISMYYLLPLRWCKGCLQTGDHADRGINSLVHLTYVYAMDYH